MVSSVPSGVSRDSTAALAALEVAHQPVLATPSKAPAPRGEAVLAAAAGALTKAKKKPTRTASKKRTPTGYAPSTSKTSGSTSKASSSRAGGALAFLDDPRLTTEEKLFRFMMYVTEKYDRDIEQKMKDAGGSGSSTVGGTTTTKKTSSNPFSKIAGALKTVFPAAGIALETLNNKNLQSLIKSISGPALAAGATALGMPALAPILAKAGPQLAGVTFDLAKALDAPASTTTTSTSGSSSGASGDPEVDRRKVMELQYAMDKQKEMFSLVSNILRSMHDMKMVAVQNIRS